MQFIVTNLLALGIDEGYSDFFSCTHVNDTLVGTHIVPRRLRRLDFVDHPTGGGVLYLKYLYTQHSDFTKLLCNATEM
jgi:hypothetical protein